MIKIFAGVGGVWGSEVRRPHRGSVLVPARWCEEERFRDYPRQNLAATPDSRHRAEIVVRLLDFICSYTLIISNLLHSALIQQPFEYFQ